VVKEFLPYLRQGIAKKLNKKYGLSTKEISEKLMVSYTSVIKYFKNSLPPPNIGIENISPIIEDLAYAIAKNTIKPSEFILKVCTACMLMRIEGEICSIHRRYIKELEHCHICKDIYRIEESKLTERQQVLRNLRQAFEMLKEIDNFDKIIPEVRTNIVMAITHARNINDIAAFPGRITVIEGKPVKYGEPRFGASKFMSKILLEALKVNPDYREMICIKYSRTTIKAARKIGFKTKSTKLDSKKISDILRKYGKLDIIADLGGKGIEPIIYIFGKDAVDTVKKTMRIAKEIKNSKTSKNKRPINHLKVK